MSKPLEALQVIPKEQTYDLGNGKLGVRWPAKPGVTTNLEILPDGTPSIVDHPPGEYGQFELKGETLRVFSRDPATDITYCWAFKCL